jgi:hypothetical protein
MLDIINWVSRAEAIVLQQEFDLPCLCDDDFCTCIDFENSLLASIIHQISNLEKHEINSMRHIQECLHNLPSPQQAFGNEAHRILATWISAEARSLNGTIRSHIQSLNI